MQIADAVALHGTNRFVVEFVSVRILERHHAIQFLQLLLLSRRIEIILVSPFQFGNKFPRFRRSAVRTRLKDI